MRNVYKKRTIKKKFAKRRRSISRRSNSNSRRAIRRYKQRGGALTINEAVNVIKNYNPSQYFQNSNTYLLTKYSDLYDKALAIFTKEREGSIPLLEDENHIEWIDTDDLVNRITDVDPQTGLPLYQIEQQGEITEEIIDIAQELLKVEEELGKNNQGVAPPLQIERRVFKS